MAPNPLPTDTHRSPHNRTAVRAAVVVCGAVAVATTLGLNPVAAAGAATAGLAVACAVVLAATSPAGHKEGPR